MATINWKSTVGGAWSNAADWFPARTPGTQDTVNFNLDGDSYTVSGDASVDYIDLDFDKVTFTGHVAASNEVAVNNNAVLTIAPTGVLTTGGLFLSQGSLLKVEGTVTDTSLAGHADIASVAGANASLATSTDFAFTQLYVSNGGRYAGNATLVSNGSVTLDTSAAFGGGTLTLSGKGSLILFGAAGAPAGSRLSVAENIQTSIHPSDALTLTTGADVTLDSTGEIGGVGYVYVNGGNVVLEGFNSYSGGTIVDHASLTLVGNRPAGTGAVFVQNSGALTTQADGAGAAGGETVVGGAGADTIDATAGALLVFAGNANALSFTGGTGISTVVGGSAGPLIATGGSAGDLIFGGTSGHDVLTGGSGASTLVGGAGGVLTVVGSAVNVLAASAGNTTLSGGSATGNNVFFTTGTGSTLVHGGSGLSTIIADGTNNTILGSSGTQDVFLGSGTSHFDFVSHFAGGTENIVGFTSADKLHLVDYAAGEAQHALAGTVTYQGSTILTLSDNTQIVLFGYTGVTAATFV